MSLLSREKIQALCKQYGIIPRRERGQNFLIDGNALAAVVHAAQLSKDDTVLEIGPGFGVLTEELAARAGKVIAVELDQTLAQYLREHFAIHDNVTIVQDNILHWWPLQHIDMSICRHFKVVANLPYQITSHILRILLESERRPGLIVVMVQKEVAERIVAKPGNMSMLSVMVQYYSDPEIVRVVPKNSFWPEPEVDSAIIRIKPHLNPLLKGEGTDIFFRIVKMGFSSRRKMLVNTLAAGLRRPKDDIARIFSASYLTPNVRAQELSLEQWHILVHNLFDEK